MLVNPPLRIVTSVDIDSKRSLILTKKLVFQSEQVDLHTATSGYSQGRRCSSEGDARTPAIVGV